MYESNTYENILARELARVATDVDKREASIIYDTNAAGAVEFQNMYIDLDVILQETFADTASREFLIKRASERGLSPYDATYAVLKGKFNIAVDIGSRFSLDQENFNYEVTKAIETPDEEGFYTYEVTCETIGVEGNRHFGKLIPIEYIRGLETAELTELLIPGEDEEDTEEFRQRYFDSLDPQAFGGNIADYKQKTKAIQGVKQVKVYPVWQGGGTVRLVIMDSEYGVPTAELIDLVQTTIDPMQNQGQGLGLAPIGHVVTVDGVEATTVNISFSLTFQNGGTWVGVQTQIEEIIDNYFLELKKTWEDNNNLAVRISQLESRILEIETILDIEGTTLNDSDKNLILEADNIPIRGSVTNV